MMRRFMPLALLMALPACISLGGDPPPFLLDLTSDAAVSAGESRSAAPDQVLVVDAPDVLQKLATARVPVQTRDGNVAYLEDALWVDRPARLFQRLLSETIAANTDWLVVPEANAAGKATFYLSGQLQEFGYSAETEEAVVVYDAVKIRFGEALEKRRFEARESVYDVKPGPVGDGLGRAANRVAAEVAAWVGQN